MAGLAPISLQQRIDPNGKPYIGAKAYFYSASTLTPLAIYSNNDISVELENPVPSDGYGMFPAIYIDANELFYRMRVTTSAGVVLTDLITLPVYDVPDPGAAPVTPVDGDSIAKTGDVKARWSTGSHSGWVRMNGRTMGSAASGATERANADAQALYYQLWNENSDTLHPVTGGRGASAAADFAANKPIKLPDLRGMVMVGLDDMGSSARGVIVNSVTVGGPTTMGSVGGAEEVTLDSTTVPSHTHTFSATTSTAPDHQHSIPASLAGAGSIATSGSSSGGISGINTGAAGAHSHTVSGTTGSSGSGDAHNNMPPFSLVTYYIKL